MKKQSGNCSGDGSGGDKRNAKQGSKRKRHPAAEHPWWTIVFVAAQVVAAAIDPRPRRRKA